MGSDLVEAKKKKDKTPGGMQGSPFAGQKTQMIFITIRDGMTPPSGIDKMAKDFQSLLSTGGIQVGIVGTGEGQMVAIANTIRELLEVRKFAVQMEEVLQVEYDKSKFPGRYITEEERRQHGLPGDDEHDEL